MALSTLRRRSNSRPVVVHLLLLGLFEMVTQGDLAGCGEDGATTADGHRGAGKRDDRSSGRAVELLEWRLGMADRRRDALIEVKGERDLHRHNKACVVNQNFGD
eukprot:s4653_g5.t1